MVFLNRSSAEETKKEGEELTPIDGKLLMDERIKLFIQAVKRANHKLSPEYHKSSHERKSNLSCALIEAQPDINKFIYLPTRPLMGFIKVKS